MEELERDMEALEFATPPKWAKARALVAAENVLRRQAQKSRMRYMMVGVIAAGISIVAVGTYVADMIAPIISNRGPSFSFAPSGHGNLMETTPGPLPPGTPRRIKPTPPAKKQETKTDAEPSKKKEKEKGEKPKAPADENSAVE